MRRYDKCAQIDICSNARIRIYIYIYMYINVALDLWRPGTLALPHLENEFSGSTTTNIYVCPPQMPEELTLFLLRAQRHRVRATGNQKHLEDDTGQCGINRRLWGEYSLAGERAGSWRRTGPGARRPDYPFRLNDPQDDPQNELFWPKTESAIHSKAPGTCQSDKICKIWWVGQTLITF